MNRPVKRAMFLLRASYRPISRRRSSETARPSASSNALSFSKQQRFVLPIEDAKTSETRQRRVEKTVVALREGRT